MSSTVRALLGIAHPVLGFGEGLLDRIEVRRVRRQEPQPGTGLADRRTDGLPLVATDAPSTPLTGAVMPMVCATPPARRCPANDGGGGRCS